MVDSQNEAISIIEVIRIFTENLKEDAETFKKVWDSHLNGSSTELGENSGIYHFSSKMYSIIVDDILAKLENQSEDLDFEKDTYRIMGVLMEAL